MRDFFYNRIEFYHLIFIDESHLLQMESKKEYDCWFIALKRTAYSRVGGGTLLSSIMLVTPLKIYRAKRLSDD